MRDAVIFAWYMPRIERIHHYIDALKTYYSDCDIYIGVNPNSDMKCIPILDELGNSLRITKAIVSPSIADENDNGGFQTALKLLKDSGNTYSLCHFLYNKGISYPSQHQFQISFNDYFLKYAQNLDRIRMTVASSSLIGGVAIQGEMNPKTNERYSYLLDHFATLPYNAMNYNWLIQIYGVRHEIINRFLQDAPQFCETRLRSLYHSDQSHEVANFFEYVFPQIVDRYGYFRYTFDLWPQRFEADHKLDFNTELSSWRNRNGLDSIQDFKFEVVIA